MEKNQFDNIITVLYPHVNWRDVARRVDYSYQTVISYINGDMPSVPTEAVMVDIAEAAITHLKAKSENISTALKQCGVIINK